MGRRSALLGALLFTLGIPYAASAQARDAEAQIHQGMELRQHGDDEGALRVLHEVFEWSHSPHAEAQMALAEQALGHWVDAEAHLRESLTTTRDPWIQSHRPALQGAMNTIATHVGLLELRGGVPGAAV